MGLVLLENTLVLINVSDEARNVSLTLRSEGEELIKIDDRRSPHTVTTYSLNDEMQFGTSADTFGTIKLDFGATNKNYIAYTVRTRLKEDGSFDFVNPTIFR